MIRKHYPHTLASWVNAPDNEAGSHTTDVFVKALTVAQSDAQRRDEA